MAHKTLIGGTGYEIAGGGARINSTSYNIAKGKTNINGTNYNIPFISSSIKNFIDLMSVATPTAIDYKEAKSKHTFSLTYRVDGTHYFFAFSGEKFAIVKLTRSGGNFTTREGTKLFGTPDFPGVFTSQGSNAFLTFDGETLGSCYGSTIIDYLSTSFSGYTVGQIDNIFSALELQTSAGKDTSSQGQVNISYQYANNAMLVATSDYYAINYPALTSIKGNCTNRLTMLLATGTSTLSICTSSANTISNVYGGSIIVLK